MFWLALLIVTAGDTRDTLAPYRGLPVIDIAIEAPPEENLDDLRSLIGIEPGYLLKTEDIQSAVKRLYALGRFADLQVLAHRQARAVRLTFRLQGIQRAGRVILSGLEAVDENLFRRALRIVPGDEVDSATPHRLKERARIYLERRGYPDATVRVRSFSGNLPLRTDFEIDVRENEALKVSGITFGSAARIPRQALLAELRTRVGAVLDRDTLDEDAKTLLRVVQRKGFLAAKLETPLVERNGAQAKIIIKLTAGPRFAFAYRGHQAISEKLLRSVEPDSVQSMRETDVRAHARRIRELYTNLGYPETDIRTGVYTSKDGLTVRVLHAIDEGVRRRVQAIEFPGAKHIEEEILRDQVQSILRRALRPENLFERMGATDADITKAFDRGDTAHSHPSAVSQNLIPAEQRWVPDLYKNALDELRSAYRDRGFLAAQIGPWKIQDNPSGRRVIIPIQEGLQTKINSIAFGGHAEVEATHLLDAIEQNTAGSVAPGAPFSPARVEEARFALVRAYRDKGYLYARVFQRVTFHNDTQAEIAFSIEEGPQVRVRRILVRGNRYTNESVIRSRLSLEVGSIYRIEQALEDQRAIQALDVFRLVRVRLINEEKPEELKDLVVEVEERDRQSFDALLNVTSARGISAGLSYGHRNIFGTASSFTTSIRASRRVFFSVYRSFEGNLEERYRSFSAVDELEREIRIGLRSPQFYGLPARPSLRVDLLHEREITIPYSLNLYTLIFGIDFQPADSLRLSIEPQGALTDLECESVSSSSQVGNLCSDTVRGQRRVIDEGLRRTFKVGPSLTWDLRDDPFNPRWGALFRTEAQYAIGASPLDLEGGDSRDLEPFSFTRFEANISAYLPIGRKSSFAFSLHGGQIVLHRGLLVPVDERFYLGGRSTLRGFVEGTLVAEDQCVVRAEDLNGAATDCTVRQGNNPPDLTGGRTFAVAKGELRLPLAGNFSLGLFIDAGNLWRRAPGLGNIKLRVGTGAGIRYRTPVGPLALDFAFNPDPRRINGEVSQVVHFSIGVF